MLGEGNLIICCKGSWQDNVWSVGQQNNNNPKFQGRHILQESIETYAIMSTQVTYETQHISLLVTQQCQMLYIFYFYVFYCNLKKKIILEDM